MSYTYSKSIDYNSQNQQGLVVQDSYNVRNDRGLSDFDARNRIVVNAIYNGSRMENVWLASALWIGLALLASIISIRR